MLTQKQGDIFQVTSGIIAHGCNARGVMGAGVAALVREKYPDAYRKYKAFCDLYQFDNLLGRGMMVEVTPTLYIANMITQELPGPNARIGAIRTALTRVVDYASELSYDVHSVRIGCGIGGLKWDNEVECVYEEVAKRFPHVNITVWEY